MSLLAWIQGWYEQRCDGEWEHTEGITIATLDNPGWRIDISLIDTEYENKEFESVEDYRTEDNWIVCEVKDGKFNGAGGPLNLEEIIKVFHDWILS